MTSPMTLIYTLPPSSAPNSSISAWWLIEEKQISAHGRGRDWPTLPANAAIIALAPASDCPVDWLTLPGLAPRQAQTAARHQAMAARIDGDALHSVAGLPLTDGTIPVAMVSHAAMQRWIQDGATHIVPAATLLSEARQQATGLMIGEERLLRFSGKAFAVDETIADVVLAGQTLDELSVAQIDEQLVALAHAPLIDLKTGPYAPPRASLFEARQLKLAAMLIGLILLVSLAMGVARLARIHADIASIDARAAAAASQALNRTVAADNAVAELDARTAATGASRGSVSATLAALMQAMEGHPSVGLDAARWDRSGTLTVTLGATRAEDINPVLLALQSAGYRITAQPRNGSDGRALGDITVRSEP